MPKQTPMIGPRPVGPQASKQQPVAQGNENEPEPSAEDYSIAHKVMGRSEEPKLQGNQNVTASGGGRGGEAPGFGSLPQAQPPQFGSMVPGSWSPAAPGRGALPSTMGPSPTDPSQGAFHVVDPAKVLVSHPELQIDTSRRFYS